MFTNCNAVTIYHSEGAVNHIPIFSRHIIQNVYWEETIGSRQSEKEVQQSDSIYVCIPASSVTDYVPARDDLLFRGIISEEKNCTKYRRCQTNTPLQRLQTADMALQQFSTSR